MSPSILRKRILSELDAYAEPLTATGLAALVAAQFPDIRLGDILPELGVLRDQELVAFVADPLAPDDRALRQWTITTKGQLTLRR